MFIVLWNSRAYLPPLFGRTDFIVNRSLQYSYKEITNLYCGFLIYCMYSIICFTRLYHHVTQTKLPTSNCSNIVLSERISTLLLY